MGVDSDFYEDDEPVEKILGIFEQGPHGTTAPPGDLHPEEERRADVSVAEMVEDHPDPAGEVKLWPLADPDDRPEDVDGW